MKKKEASKQFVKIISQLSINFYLEIIIFYLHIKNLFIYLKIRNKKWILFIYFTSSLKDKIMDLLLKYTWFNSRRHDLLGKFLSHAFEIIIRKGCWLIINVLGVTSHFVWSIRQIIIRKGCQLIDDNPTN